MPRIKSIPTEYYTLQGGVGYKTFLDHFKHQAAGQHQAQITVEPLYTGGRQKRENRRSRLRLVKLATETTPSDTPKVEVIDPNEAIKNRAVSQLKHNLAGDNVTANSEAAQSTTRQRRRNNPGSKAAASKAVKRARDVFDN